MRLLSLQVKGVSCFRNPVKLDGFDPHINLIYGPNEIGKSTLITAMARAFFDRSSTKAQEVIDMRPWGTALSPEIVVEFVGNTGMRAGSTRLKLEKGFLDTPYTRLSEWTGSGYELLADGDKAEEMLRAMWRSSLPGRGATGIDQWGLARLLWFRQDRERFDCPKLNDRVLLNELRQALNVMTVTKEEEALLRAIESELSQILTDKQRSFRKGSAVAALRERKKQLLAEIAGCDDRLREIQDLSAKIIGLKDSIEAMSVELENKSSELQGLQGEVERVKELSSKLAVARSELQALRSQKEALLKDREAVNRAKVEIAELEKRLEKAQKDLETAQTAAQDAEKQVAEHAKALQALRDKLSKSRQDLERCRKIHQLRTCDGEIRRKRSLLEKLRAKNSELEKVDEQLSKISAPSADELAQAANLRETITRLEAGIEAAGLSLDINALADVTVEFDAGTRSEQHYIGKGESKVLHATQQAVLRVPDLLTISIKSGSGEIAKMQEKLDDARAQLAALLAKFGVDGMVGLQALAHRAATLRQNRERLSNEIDELLSSEGMIQARLTDLEAQIEQLEVQLESGLDKLCLTAGELSSVDPGDEDSLCAEIAELENLESDTQQLLERSRRAAADAQELKTKLSTLIDAGKKQCSELQARIRDLLERFGGSEEQLVQKCEAICRATDQKEAAVKELESSLPSEREDPVKRSTALKAEIDNLIQQLEQKKAEISRYEGALEQLAPDDIYLRKSRAEEQLELTERELRRELIRARALSLISELFKAHRQAMSSGLSTAIEDRVTKYWAFVRGRQDVKARIGDDMELAAVNFIGDRVDPERFSAGAREQLYVVVRLAVAELLSESDPQIVVLDDALVFTDQHRHSRMLDLIKRLSEKMQVIILTSHQDRFESLPGARFNVEELTRPSAEYRSDED